MTARKRRTRSARSTLGSVIATADASRASSVWRTLRRASGTRYPRHSTSATSSVSLPMQSMVGLRSAIDGARGTIGRVFRPGSVDPPLRLDTGGRDLDRAHRLAVETRRADFGGRLPAL